MPASSPEPDSGGVILFDGVCNLCNASVNFIVDHDPRKQFRFAALQSPAGQQFLREHHVSTTELSSLVLIDAGRAFTRSTAALRIARRLRPPWNLLYALIILPRFLRDPLYNLIARHRYRWFGKRNACLVPTPELAARFLPDPPDTPRSSPAPATAHVQDAQSFKALNPSGGRAS
jgi:predicted DCC family thiol-disulfide oxidoreductase YuxK